MAIKKIALGKPAAYGQEITKRRLRLTTAAVKLQNKIVLDFGCGNGAQTGEFVQTDCKILAVDVVLSDLQILQQCLAPRRAGHLMPIQYNGSHLPVASGVIDIVVSFDVLEHVGDEAAALREIHRVLKPDGELVLTVPNKGWIFETHGAYLPVLPWHRVPFLSWLPHPLHRRIAKARIYRRRDIVGLLRRHSFEILQTHYMTAPLDVVKNTRLKRFLRALVFRGDTTRLSVLATAIFIHGRKVSAPRGT
jgi:2-polyprenyl-3-methyl-5-hydroxy-6-metoxy-1,4-benzoquinol methylase